MNRKADSYYVNSELFDSETPDLLKFQYVQRISLTPTDSLSNSNDTPVLGANITLPSYKGVTLTPTIYMSNSSEYTPALNVIEIPIVSKSATYRAFLIAPNHKT